MSCFCFFFFKQKTAYEMRISDWSSDVCSSDLPFLVHRLRLVDEHLRLHPRVRGLGAGLVEQHHQHDPLQVVEVEFVLVERHRPVEHQLALGRVEDAVLLEHHQETAALEIGRASCREGVCQSVKISVFAVTVKKKTK